MTTRLYHFWIEQEDKYSAPFALCDRHQRELKIPDHVTMSMVSDETEEVCNKCPGPKGNKET